MRLDFISAVTKLDVFIRNIYLTLPVMLAMNLKIVTLY